MTTLPASIQLIERGWLSSNLTLMFDDDQATLVDSGYIKHAQMTVALVRHALQARNATLARIVNTHLHSDHCGGNAALAKAFDAPIWVPRDMLDAVARWDEDALTYRPTGQRCDRFVASGGVAPGQTLTMGGLDWTAHAAPGHDPHSLIFHCAEHGILMSADALWANGFGVIFPELHGASGFAEQGAVLDLIETLDVRIVIPGHGPAFDDVADAIARARSRLAAMRSSPPRHAAHAIKVLVKYLLMDLERATLADVLHTMRDATSMHEAARQMGTTLDVAVRDSADALVAQGQLLRDGAWLVEPGAAQARS